MHGHKPLRAGILCQLRRFGDFEIPWGITGFASADGQQSHVDVVRPEAVGKSGIRDSVARMVDRAITEPHQVTEVRVAAERGPVELVMRRGHGVNAIVEVFDAQSGVGGDHALVADAERVRVLGHAFRDDQLGAAGGAQDAGNRGRVEMMGVRVGTQNQAGMRYILRAERRLGRC